MNLPNFDPQVATSGAYAMESVAWLFASMIVFQRTAKALLRVRRVSTLHDLFLQRSARLAASLSVLLMMGFLNRVTWWKRHTFTDTAFFNTDYSVAIQSMVLTVVLYFVISNLNGKEDQTFGIRNSFIMAVGSVVAFILSSLFYASGA